MRIEGGAHTPKKKKKGFISNTFIISKDDTPQRKTGKIISIIASLLIVAAVVMGGTMIYGYLNAGNANEDLNGSISSDLPNSDVVSGDDTSSLVDGETPVSSEADVFVDGILAEFTELYALNPDFLGRVYIPDTQLDQVVAQGKDNDYYLTHTLEKKKDPYGTVFLDARATVANNAQSNALTLYGHNSKAGDFFQGIKLYKDIEYYKEHPIVNFDTIYGKGAYKIIGYFTEYVELDKPHFNYNDYIDLTKEHFDQYLTELDKRNYFESGIDVKNDDYLLALSTCNDEIQGPVKTPYRDVLVARKVRPGESLEVDTSKFKTNTDMIMPEGWVKKFGKANPYK